MDCASSRRRPGATFAPHPPSPRGHEEAPLHVAASAGALGLPPERPDPVCEDDDGRDEDDDEDEHEDDGEQPEQDVVAVRRRRLLLLMRGAGASVREPEALSGQRREGRECLMD